MQKDGSLLGWNELEANDLSSDFEREFELFGKVAALPPAERAKYLDAHAPSPEMRQRILELVAHATDENHPLEKPLVAPLDPALALPDETATILSPGTLLSDRYRIIRHIAGGTFGSVYEASDLNLTKQVVVKVLKTDGAWVRQHFDLERDSLARLRHPGIVAVTDRGQTSKGWPFIVLDFIEGHTLQAELRQSGALTIVRAAALIGGLGEALEHAHQRGVIHRDLKPGNIMLAAPGTLEERPVIIDFGIAKLKAPADAVASTTAIAGTGDYWAPEQALGGAISPSVDTFALGMIAFEILTGKRFRQLEPGLAGIGTMERRLKEFAPNVPDAARAAIAACIATEPAERPRSARDAAESMKKGLVRGPHQSVPVLLSRRQMTTPLIAGVALGAAAIGGGLWYEWPQNSKGAAAFQVEHREASGWRLYEGSNLNLKDQVRIRITPSEPAWLYMASPERDKLYAIFPARGQSSAELRAPVLVPSSQGFELQQSSSEPLEMWIALARAPIPELERSWVDLVRNAGQSDEIMDHRVHKLWERIPVSKPLLKIELGVRPTFVRFAWTVIGQRS